MIFLILAHGSDICISRKNFQGVWYSNNGKIHGCYSSHGIWFTWFLGKNSRSPFTLICKVFWLIYIYHQRHLLREFLEFPPEKPDGIGIHPEFFKNSSLTNASQRSLLWKDFDQISWKIPSKDILGALMDQRKCHLWYLQTGVQKCALAQFCSWQRRKLSN